MPCLSPRSVDVHPKTIGCLLQEKLSYRSTSCSRWTLRFTFAGSRWRFSKTVKSCQWCSPTCCVSPGPTNINHQSTSSCLLGGDPIVRHPCYVEELNTLHPPQKPECSALKLAPRSHVSIQVVSKHEHYLPVANLFQAVLPEGNGNIRKLSKQLSHEKSSFLSASNAHGISTVNACESTLWLLKDLGLCLWPEVHAASTLFSIHVFFRSMQQLLTSIIIALPCFWCEGEADLSRFQTVGSVGNRWIPAWRFRPVDFADSPNPKCPNVGAFQPSQSQGCQQEIPKRCQKT